MKQPQCFMVKMQQKIQRQAAKEAFSGNSLGSNLPSIKINSKNIR